MRYTDSDGAVSCLMVGTVMAPGRAQRCRGKNVFSVAVEWHALAIDQDCG
jgi:hypothetical protein